MKNLKKISTVIIAIILLTVTANAQTYNTATTADNFSVKYTGTEANYLLFEVEIIPVENETSILKISDRTEGELYNQNWRPKSSYQLFKIEKQDGQQLIFNLQVGNREYIKTFSATTRLIEKTTVQENSLVVL